MVVGRRSRQVQRCGRAGEGERRVRGPPAGHAPRRDDEGGAAPRRGSSTDRGDSGGGGSSA
eukprot:2165390-Pyramimonas_sp.AAC.1